MFLSWMGGETQKVDHTTCHGRHTNSPEFKLNCPVASGHLPLKQEWLKLMEAKYTTDTANLAFVQCCSQERQ